MNFRTRAKMSSRLIFSYPSPSQRLFNLHPQTPSLQRSDFYSTKPKTQKPRSPPSSTFSQRVRTQTEALSAVWTKPGDMPYQAKVANFVNLIGRVELPVRFECIADGRYFATAVISILDGGEKKSPMVPVVFEGDLAHVVSCYVKENDCVFVAGQLSVGPTREVSSDSLGKFHVVAENICFVEGFKKNEVKDKVFDKMPERAGFSNGHNNMFDEMPERIADVEHHDYSGSEDESVMQAAAQVDRGVAYKSKLRKDNGNKKKEEEGLWRDIPRNPQQWLDFRNHKSSGLVTEKHPDFKHKVTGEALWIDNMPKWLLPGIGRLEFGVKNINPKQVKGATGDDSWKNLVENPKKWWDNRFKKTNPKGPDFKHKETGEVLWLNRAPAWALSKLPPLVKI